MHQDDMSFGTAVQTLVMWTGHVNADRCSSSRTVLVSGEPHAVVEGQLQKRLGSPVLQANIQLPLLR